MTTAPRDLDLNIGQALALVHDAWAEMARSPMACAMYGLKVDRLPRIDLAAAERRSSLGMELMERAAALDLRSLPHELKLTVQVAIGCARRWSREADWYWLVFDPLGAGFYAQFAPTAYCGGYLLGQVNKILREFDLSTRGDIERYLGMVLDYADLVEQMRERTEGQAARGIYMPKEQLEGARQLMAGLKAQAAQTLTPAVDRIPEDLRHHIDRVRTQIIQSVHPAFDAMLAAIGDDYAGYCPDRVGLGSYEGGEEVYAELAKLHTTLELTPEEIHARGLERMADIWRKLDAEVAGLGFDGSPREFVAAAGQDPKWRADTPEAIGSVFQRYIDRLAPKLAEVFHVRAKAPYGVLPLPEALTASMTYGYYDPPTEKKPRGDYLFNGRNLSQTNLCGVAALAYHELAPGHHLHIARQFEADHLHPLRKLAFWNAYNEGWAEYAAELARELGGYQAPQERIGRLMTDAFLTSRLVVDTGMNALGWSLEQAREYMRRHTFAPEQEIQSETLRYTCGMPGQALAYKLGDVEIMKLRDEMRNRLKNRFDIRDFHEAVLGPGALPLPILADHVRHETERLEAGRA